LLLPAVDFLLNEPVHFRKITIVGVGLLGGSIGLAARKRRLAGQVAGFVRRKASVAECLRAGAVDVATRDLREAVEDADLVILCTPLSRMRSLVMEMLPALRPGAILTDVGSVKGPAVRSLESLAGKAGARFVGSHPMAGAETAGVAAARADLFDRAVCVVTPTRRTDPVALRKVERFWKALGARPLRLDPERHDVLVSRSSHLPHIAAVILANLVLDPAKPRHQADLCASGFRDATRIASGSPELWRDIAMANRKNLDRALAAYGRELEKFRRALRRSDAGAVSRALESAKRRRDAWRAPGAPASSE
jgi:prephenate dehydrogenase